MPNTTARPISRLGELETELVALEGNRTLAQAKRAVVGVIRLLDSSADMADASLYQVISDDQGKIRANADWFMEDEVLRDRRAVYKIHSENSLNTDFKLFGIQKPGKRAISWAQALTPNFEDEEFNSRYNVGIDFVVPKTLDRVIVVLSSNYVVRTLELKGKLTVTYHDILGKWLDIVDFANKRAMHTMLWESFDLLPINKKFYTGVSERFVILRQHLETTGLMDARHASMFANRLIGRIIFCWFLDRKGVINDKIKYFEVDPSHDSTTHYRERLESLFYEVLNTPITQRSAKDLATPFLNGGLFEPKASDFYRNTGLTFPKGYFADLFDFLRHYNFTTDESTSQFQQVAIDPEMLGRIFENLLAEITEDTGEQARKAKGAFYTPREIVDYMCRESLKQYLKGKLPVDQNRDQRLAQLIDETEHRFKDQEQNWRRDWKPYKTVIIDALDEFTVLDPACGSGAFPMGMLQLLVQVYDRLEARFDPYKTKLGIIKRNIYGVDIEPMAIEISRLRAWLSIVVDEESDSTKIKPLPNLDFKFVCANTLLPLERKMGNDESELEQRMREVRDEYYGTGSYALKLTLRKRFEKLLGLGKTDNLLASGQEKQLTTYRPFDGERSASFFDPDFMFGIKGGFDLIIGNPPYIKEYTNKKAFDGLHEDGYYQGKMDLWYFFACKGLDMVKPDSGVVTLIAQNNWVTSHGASKMRTKIVEDSQIMRLIDFGDCRVFESAGIQTMVMIFMRSRRQRVYSYEYCRFDGGAANSCTIAEFLGRNAKVGSMCNECVFDRVQMVNKTFSFGFGAVRDILGKILAKSNYRLEENEVAQGIVCPQDVVNKKSQTILGDSFSVGEGVFVLTDDELERLAVPANEKLLIKPFYTSAKIGRWFCEPKNDKWIIYTDSKFKNPNSMDSYPVLKRHLDRFQQIITSSNKPYGLHRSRDQRFFIGPKVVSIRKCASPTFTYSDSDCYVSETFNVIKSTKVQPKFLVGLLNSSLIRFWLRHNGKMQGSNFQIDKEPLINLPLIKADVATTQKIESKVDEIIAIKKTNPKADTKALEAEIDKIIFDLYGLTDEEIKVVTVGAS